MQLNTEPSKGIGAEFAPLSEAHRDNPYQFFARARLEEPIFYAPALNMWVVTRYHDVQAVVEDNTTFSSVGTFTALSAESNPEFSKLIQQSYTFTVANMSNSNPTDHTRLRNAVGKSFSSRWVASLEPQIQQLANQLIDKFVAKNQPVEIMSQFAYPLPCQVISRMLGIADRDFEQVNQWTDSLTALMFQVQSNEEQIKCARSLLDYERYLLGLFEQKRAQPQDDLISNILKAIDSGEANMSVPELVSMVSANLIIGGYETTAKGLGNIFKLLLSERQHWQQLVNEPNLIPKAIEECLRLDTAVLGFFRTTTTDAHLGGATIPKGSVVYVLFSSANHDESLFPKPTEYSLERENIATHLAFSRGTHFCMGAALARLELKVALELLISRLPSLRLAPGQELHYIPGLVLHGLDHLLLEW